MHGLLFDNKSSLLLHNKELVYFVRKRRGSKDFSLYHEVSLFPLLYMIYIVTSIRKYFYELL